MKSGSSGQNAVCHLHATTATKGILSLNKGENHFPAHMITYDCGRSLLRLQHPLSQHHWRWHRHAAAFEPETNPKKINGSREGHEESSNTSICSFAWPTYLHLLCVWSCSTFSRLALIFENVNVLHRWELMDTGQEHNRTEEMFFVISNFSSDMFSAKRSFGIRSAHVVLSSLPSAWL